MTATDGTLEDLKKQFLVCDICDYLYDNETREPRLLPCLHTYCTMCVQKLIKDELVTCPHCRQDHQVPGNDANAFKKDNNRRELLDFVTVRSKAPELICNLCGENEDDNKAVTRCFECAQFLCVNCTKSHKGCKFTKGHEIVALDSLKESSLDNFTHIQFCSVTGHQHNKLSLYCEKCEATVCIHCTATTHKDADGHKIRNIDEVSAEGMETVISQLKGIEDLRIRTTDIIEKVEQTLASLAEVEKNVNSKIEAMVKSCIEMLNRRQAELKDELSVICSNKGKVLEQQLINAKQHQQNITDSIKFAKQTLQHKNPANFLQIRKVITDRFDQLLKEPLDNFPHENDKITLKDVNLIEFQKQVLSHGRICSTSVFPPNTVVKVLDLVDAGRNRVLKLILCDYQGDPQPTDDISVQVDIKDPDNMEVKTEVNHEGKGQVTVICDATKQGWYTARVSLLEADVWDGKFQLQPLNGTDVPAHGTKASIDLLSVEEARKIYLRCPSCQEEFGFDSDCDIPILLPCLHSLGKKCSTKRLQNFNLECPTCQIVHQIQNLDEMPVDPTKAVLKEYLDIRDGSIPCSYGCQNHSNVRCMECSVFLCETCFTNHRRNFMFRDHNARVLKAIGEDETITELSKIPMCSIRGHDKKELTAFCESCDVLVCNTCALSKQHKSDTHNMEIDLMKVYDDKKAALNNEMERLRTKKNNLIHAIKAVEFERDEVKNNLHTVLNDINDSFSLCEKSLRSRREYLIIQASKFTTILIENLNTQLEQLRTHAKMTEETINLSLEKLNFCGKVVFITVEKILSQRIRDVIGKPYESHPCYRSSLSFLKDNIEEATSQTFPNLGHLLTPDV
ncbi:hypothetical protein CHS0354_035901 [Potamilus streckersoni]|uniref:Uncharacterized protein n=1 Tax=Potamilus streckersoni TaxID=2493646 RepID=A0AAE0T6C1_9BIVA|nr:hypothetical protein CHS0354_035901 [Potamilus streckersoni]